jgi:hypothetical protein
MLFVITTACNSNKNENTDKTVSKSEMASVEKNVESEEKEHSNEADKTVKGKVVLNLNGKIFETTGFVPDPSSPRSEWLTNMAEGMENQVPTLAMAISGLRPSQCSVLIGYTGKKVNNKNLSGSFPIGTEENTFTISLIMDNNMKNFTFSKGTVEVEKLTPETVKLKAEGIGLYADNGKQQYKENEKATFELELSFPNILIDGKEIKRIKI